MTFAALYTGVETADVAMLHESVGGITYRCYVWRNAPQERIEAALIAEGEDGQHVLVDKAIVAGIVGDHVDCPRVLAVGNLFVVHWVDWTDAGGSSLYRSIFDVTDITTGWSAQGFVALHTTNLYDHAVVVGSSPEEFVVARRTAVGTITTARYDGMFSWVDIAWTNADAGLTIADNVLAVHANETDNTLLVSYQDTLTLQTYRRDAAGGLNLAGPVETFPDLDSGDNHFTAVGHARVDADTYMVVAEAIDSADFTAGGNRDFARMLAWRQIRGDTAVVGDESHWAYNLHMLSKPWSYATGVTAGIECYVACSFKSVAETQEFEQSYGYVVRLDRASLTGASAAGVLRPIPCAAFMAGTVDARPHGSSPVATDVSIGSRMNHLSAAVGPPQYTLGPNIKAVTFAVIRFGRLVLTEDETALKLTPAQAAVGYYDFYHEDAWAIRRWPDEPTQPDTPAWRGTSRSMCLPIETAGGLVWTGGVTSCYDGRQIVEQGFFHAPEILTATPVAMGGNMDDAQTYHWYCNYVWQDARGQIHRSPPSRPVSAAIVVDGFVNLEVRPCALSMKDDTFRYPTAGPINIEVWRTTTDGAGSFETAGNQTVTYLFRREFASWNSPFQLQDTPVSDNSDFSQTIATGRPNSEVRNSELSPFQLDLTTLQWTPPPPTPHRPLTVAASWKNRLFGVDPEDPRVIHYSEEQLPLGTQYKWHEFLDTNVFRFDGKGEITALQAMDDILLVFTRDAVYRLSGDPASGGAGATLQLQVITQGIGCVAARSVVLTTEGVFFQSAKGIHQVTRGGSVAYPGAPVEDLVREAGNVRSAVHIRNRHQIRFTLQALPGTGPLVVRPRIITFDYRVGLWSIREIPMLAQTSTASRLNEMQHACEWLGLQGEALHVVLQQGGLAIERSDDDTVYSDVGAGGTASIPLDITTEWIHLAGIAGFKRLKEIGIQTERVNAGEMTVEAWYDFDGSYDSSGAPTTTRVYASPADDYLRFAPDIELVSAIKLRIYESGTVAATENVRLISMTIQWAKKPTNRRVAV